ncbi:hypothetical protein PYDG_00082 [Pseudoalteromonas phage pYD6-A]|uniref:TMhelix containing protein n=1 Tax=Pseudoalteromonas phage pYD6-A TaxID=754052 RepID=M4SS29_9CAUD|nr:hypothetical protein PYDG_00082 [Pseudoalteromonas phage pYD6-A]AGH57611.1 hypothetical protein PYDG_00082 [Pseudoalteromonas phage pYD6-A]
MGRYQTTVASSATSLFEIEGETGPNLIAGLSFKHDYPHIPKVLDTMYNGLAIRIHQAYNYGRDFYTYGLPNGYEEVLGDVPVSTIEALISAEVGYPVTVQTIQVEEPDDVYMAEYHAWKYWGWKYVDEYLTTPPVAPIKGYNVKIEETAFNPYGNLNITFNIGKNISGDDVLIDYLLDKSELDPEPDQSKIYYHVRFLPTGATTPNYEYWIYEVGSGTYPDIDDITLNDLGSPFLPVIPLRQDNQNLGPEVEDGDYVLDVNGSRIRPDTDLYRTSVKLCDKLDTDFDRLCLDISNNPDIRDIDHAYLIFGIDIRSEHKIGQSYLYDFFEDLAVKAPGAQSIIIQDAKYKVRLSYTSNTRTVIVGELGKPIELTYAGETLTIRRDLNNGTYGQIVITDLLHTNYVYGSHAVKTSLSDSEDPDNYNFIVPLNYDLFRSFKGLLNRQGLLKESFKIVFNSFERRKLKWYERGIFKALLLVIAIVITVWSAGTAYAGIAAAYQAGGIAAAISAASTMILTALAVGTAVKWLASQLPPELGIVVAVVLTALAIGGYTGTINFEFVDAEGFLSLTNAVLEGTQEGLANDMAELMDEINSFMSEAEAAQEELDNLWSELDVSADWFTETIMEQTQLIKIESPEEFYTRTIHAGNIGTATLSQIENYVDKSLELPELREI